MFPTHCDFKYVYRMSPISNILLLQIEPGNGSGHAPTAAADAIRVVAWTGSGQLNIHALNTIQIKCNVLHSILHMR